MSTPRRDRAWGALGAFVAVAVVVAGVLVAWVSASGEHGRIEENRAISLARSLAYVAAHGSPAEVNDYIQTLDEATQGTLVEAYVMEAGGVDRFGLSAGNRYGAHLDPELAGTDPQSSEDPRQKELYDRTQSATGGAEGHLDRVASSNPDGLGVTAPYIVIHTDQTDDATVYLNVNVPFVRGAAETPDEVSGVAGVSVTVMSPAPRAPWGVAFLLLAVAGGGLFFLGLQRPNRDAVPALMAVGMLALMAVVSVWLGGWEERSYQDKIGVYAAEANIWLASAAEQSDGQVVDYALRTYRDARVEDLTTPPFAQGSAVRDGGAGTSFLLTFLLMGLLLVGLHRFLVDTFRQVATDPWAYIYVLPSMVGMILLVFGPFLFGVVLAFHERDAGRFVPVGLEHFTKILSGEKSSEVSFYWTLFVTLFWTVTNVVIHVAVGLTLALVLNDQLLRFKKFYRVILILPWAIPNYITALIWRGLFDANDGAVNLLLNKFGVASVDWLGGSFATAFTANLVTNAWLGFPFMMVVSLGALQSIPLELYEAADVDGATRWQKFRTITLPLLKPALFPAIILGAIWTFNMFNIIYLVSGGGPNHSTEILITEAYKAFYVMGRWGYAAAYSVMIFLILLLFSSLMNRMSKATEGAFD